MSRPTKNASMIRVDQAGEYGATRIYAGQLAVMGDRHPMAREIAHMAEQEERHRKFFDAMVARRGVRPTALQPVWNVAGFALGAVTAAMGPRAAMACTAAVETEIDRHYRHQLDELGDSDPELSAAAPRNWSIRKRRSRPVPKARPAIRCSASQSAPVAAQPSRCRSVSDRIRTVLPVQHGCRLMVPSPPIQDEG